MDDLIDAAHNRVFTPVLFVFKSQIDFLFIVFRDDIGAVLLFQNSLDDVLKPLPGEFKEDLFFQSDRCLLVLLVFFDSVPEGVLIGFFEIGVVLGIDILEDLMDEDTAVDGLVVDVLIVLGKS